MLVVLRCLMVSLFLATPAWLAPRTWAQQPQTEAQQKAADFSATLQRWQDTQDPDQKVELGEQLLALEAALASWPLDSARERVRGDIRFGLGIAYIERPRGVRADNLEKAIAHLEAVLVTWTRESVPQDWATAHNNLGIAYWGRIQGARADNQEKAAAHFEAALTVFSRDANPHQWAQLQNNLAVLYWNRTHGERAANLETAIAHSEAALTVFTREANPHQWAAAQNNLGSAYRSRIRGDRADNREQAITHLEAALTVFTHTTFPHDWARAHNNLGIAYLDRVRGESSENQEKAIAAFEAALTVFTSEGQPYEWAHALHNIGIAYAGRVRGERGDNQRKAIAAYEAALTVFTREASPRDHLRTSRLLARLFLEARDWHKAAPHHASARQAFLLLFGQGLDEAETRGLIGEAGPLFSEAAFAAIERGELEAALEIANEGRARLLAVALKLQTLGLSPDQRRHVDALRAAIRAGQQAVEAARGIERAETLDKLIALRQELLSLIKRAGEGQGAPASALAKARDVLAEEGGAVAVPVLTGLGAKVLLVAKAAAGETLTVVNLPPDTSDRLFVLLKGPSSDPALTGWLGAYFINHLQGEELTRRWPEWLSAIDGLAPELWRLFGAQLDAALKERGVAPGKRLVLLPPGALGILPLGLAQDPASKRRLGDTYEIVYAPSLDALAAAHSYAAKAEPATLAIIINPTGDLPGTEQEGKLVASYFASRARTVLEREAATPDAVLAALKGTTHWHFASHGTFSWTDARQSALVMHGTQWLSVGRLLETEGLGRPRLVVLSACETGLYDITRNPDEFIGLPGAFTTLGAAGVLGTLWPVSDAATALLIAKFYELHMGSRLPPPTALHRAQAWLRQATSADLNTYAKVAAAQGRLENRNFAAIEQELSEEGLRRSRNSAVVEWIARDPNATDRKSGSRTQHSSRPYAHPYFWAGFIHTGL